MADLKENGIEKMLAGALSRYKYVYVFAALANTFKDISKKVMSKDKNHFYVIISTPEGTYIEKFIDVYWELFDIPVNEWISESMILKGIENKSNVHLLMSLASEKKDENDI